MFPVAIVRTYRGSRRVKAGRNDDKDDKDMLDVVVNSELNQTWNFTDAFVTPSVCHNL